VEVSKEHTLAANCQQVAVWKIILVTNWH